MECNQVLNLCKTCQASVPTKADELVFQASGPKDTYGFRFFDKPVDYEEEEDDDSEEYEEKSCGANCCDKDCECDDCLRCSDTGLRDIDSYADDAAAA